MFFEEFAEVSAVHVADFGGDADDGMVGGYEQVAGSLQAKGLDVLGDRFAGGLVKESGKVRGGQVAQIGEVGELDVLGKVIFQIVDGGGDEVVFFVEIVKKTDGQFR